MVKKLQTFRIEEDKQQALAEKAGREGTNVSAVLIHLVDKYIDNELDSLDTSLDNNIDSLDERIDTKLDKATEQIKHDLKVFIADEMSRLHGEWHQQPEKPQALTK